MGYFGGAFGAVGEGRGEAGHRGFEIVACVAERVAEIRRQTVARKRGFVTGCQERLLRSLTGRQRQTVASAESLPIFVLSRRSSDISSAIWFSHRIYAILSLYKAIFRMCNAVFNLCSAVLGGSFVILYGAIAITNRADAIIYKVFAILNGTNTISSDADVITSRASASVTGQM
ncbi:MAG: hypothetical protein IPL32_03605 [Chloracidobacterium sp.]|nr:hypothetical protein [Chloracidobacterium sp.]